MLRTMLERFLALHEGLVNARAFFAQRAKRLCMDGARIAADIEEQEANVDGALNILWFVVDLVEYYIYVCCVRVRT